jgi:hypothetical protein
MEAPGSYFLLINKTDFNITGAATYVGDWTTDLDGMVSASVQCDFRSGAASGGGEVRAFLQTSLDDGNTIVDIACMLFTGSDRRVVNVAANATSQTPASATDVTLADDTVLAGVLGNRLRLKLVSTGTWANTYLGGRMVVR